MASPDTFTAKVPTEIFEDQAFIEWEEDVLSGLDRHSWQDNLSQKSVRISA